MKSVLWAVAWIWLCVGGNQAGAQSVTIACHFVPYSHCYLLAQVPYQADASQAEAFASMRIFLDNDAFELLPGLFDARLSVMDEGREKASMVVYLRVRDDEMHIDDRFVEMVDLREFLEENSGYVLAIRTQRIPILVPDPNKESGNITARLRIDGRTVSHSRSHMAPLDGCWFDEAKCAEIRVLNQEEGSTDSDTLSGSL